MFLLLLPCGFSHKIRESFGHKRLKIDFVFPKESGHAKETSESDLLVLNPSLVSADLQHNIENNNPNSTKLGVELVNETNVTKPKLDFCAITRKKRRRTPRENNSVIGSGWFSKLSPEFNSEYGKECGEEEFGIGDGFKQTISDEYFNADGFKVLCDHEIPGTSKEASEYETDDVWKNGNSNYACYGGSDVNSVRSWLEDHGLGKYADMFELHEVDEETLPLLTVEDLKEMGMFIVGPHRKLYCAIQQLSGRQDSALDS